MEKDEKKLEEFGIDNNGKIKQVCPSCHDTRNNTHNGRFVPMEESKTPDLPNQDPVWDNSNWLGKKVPEQKRFDI